MNAFHRVLVCGATGRQDGAVSRALLSHGFEVLALTRSPRRDRDGDCCVRMGPQCRRASEPIGDIEGACRWAQVHAWKNPGLRLEPRRRIPFGKTKNAHDCRGRDLGNACDRPDQDAVLTEGERRMSGFHVHVTHRERVAA